MTLGLDGSMVMIRSALSATSAGQSRIWEEQQGSYFHRLIHSSVHSRHKANNEIMVIYFVLSALSEKQTLTCAPESWSSLQDSGKTSVAMTGYPCFSKFLAIGVPMLPSPIKPTGVLEAIDLQDTEKPHTDRNLKIKSSILKLKGIIVKECTNKDNRRCF